MAELTYGEHIAKHFVELDPECPHCQEQERIERDLAANPPKSTEEIYGQKQANISWTQMAGDYTAIGPNGEQLSVSFDDESDADNPGWLLRIVRLEEDGARSLESEDVILDATDPDAAAEALAEAERYLA